MTGDMIYKRRVVREIRIDDGTTGGKTGYIDNYGTVWVESRYSQYNAPTGECPAKMINGRIYY